MLKTRKGAMEPQRNQSHQFVFHLIREMLSGDEELVEEPIRFSNSTVSFLMVVAGAAALIYGFASGVVWQH
jgi:hypothetical protein